MLCTHHNTYTPYTQILIKILKKKTKNIKSSHSNVGWHSTRVKSWKQKFKLKKKISKCVVDNQKCNLFWIEVREHQVFFFFSMKTVDQRKTCLDTFRILLHANHLYWLLLLDLNRDDIWGQLMYFEAVKHRMWVVDKGRN